MQYLFTWHTAYTHTFAPAHCFIRLYSTNRNLYFCEQSAFQFTRMEVFKIVRKDLGICFYCPNQTHILDMKRLLAVLSQIASIISIFLFVRLEADNATDYVVSAILFVAVAGVFMSFIDTSIKTTKIFSFIDTNEKDINKSECWQPSNF